MKFFRLLKADEIECRVSKITEKGVALLLYKTARTDADILDEKIGTENWENDFKLVDGVLYGGIGVDYGKGLVWKWDAGTESNTEAEKGRASDAFKRAGFKHGIGRELYSAPFIFIPADKCNIKSDHGKFKCSDKFDVAKIEYDKAERISALEITKDGKTVYAWPKAGKKQNFEPIQAEEYTCEDCGDKLRDTTKRDGEIWPVSEIAAYSKSRFKRVLCPDCMKAAFSKEKE